ncbi:phospholipase, patatin family [Achromobacter piechaudii ATCC 43553]|uniref:Phospholipase, patatin family n=1 Tax=Achromobacter piechaudii ATCC 43553 TaxID=742159 RepID=D4XHW1_9BURK|nr:phospholipase, patatin family [Achromobacter piechaudii ATCC 43553]
MGVLSAIMDLLDPDWHSRFQNPFDIICGTSAGAINAAALACRADRPHLGVRRIRRLWSSLNTDMIYRADAPGLIRTGVRWLGLLALGWMYSGLTRKRPQSLLDNSPMEALLGRVLNFNHLRTNLERGSLSALAITASGYTSGEHLTFYQAHAPIEPWHRYLRLAIPTPISIDHLMASSSIPFVFPARQVQVHGKGEWCGDGSMRQLAPISPAIHLGAHRVLVIGTGFRDDTHPENRADSPPYPSLAQVGGHALSSIFLDGLSVDVERLERINTLMEHAPQDGAQGNVRRIQVLTLTPSQSLDTMALEHLQDMPPQARALFRVLGVSSDPGRPGGGALMSYLLFESSYTKRLIELGYADTMQRNDEVIAFFKEAQA